jgi:dipeptidyl aminopeptidase/acylaminoacyl peptidase
VVSVAFHPDGIRIATGIAVNQSDVRIWDATDGRLLHAIRHRSAVFEVAFSPGGELLATACFDGAVHLWDTDTGEQRGVLRGHPMAVIDIAFSPDGKRLVSAGEDATVRLWDVATGDQVATFRTEPQRVRSISFSPDGARIAVGMNDGTISVWDSVAEARRFKEREALRAAEPEGRRVFEAAMRTAGDHRAAAEQIRGNAALSDVVRRAALNLLTKQALGERQAKLKGDSPGSGPEER